MPIERTTPTRAEPDDTVELPTLPRAPVIDSTESHLGGTDTWTAVPLDQAPTIEVRGGPVTETTIHVLPAPVASAAVTDGAPIGTVTRASPPRPLAPLAVPTSMPILRSRALEAGRERAERYLEVLQSLEARRQLFDAMLAEREAQISERDRRIAELERAVPSQAGEPTTTPPPEPVPVPSVAEVTRSMDADDARALAALLEQAHVRAAELERAVAALQSERDRWQMQYQVAQSEHTTLQAELISLRVEHVALRERAASGVVDAARRVAEIETQMRARDDTVNELRGQLGAVRDALEQRNALIVRLEADVASSAGVLGNLTHVTAESEIEPTCLLVQEGATGRIQVLGRRTTIGRTPDNDMRIEADSVSRHHAVVLRHSDRTVIEDLNSTNGTYVNGQRVARCVLSEGDRVTLGHSDFRFIVRIPELPAAQ